MRLVTAIIVAALVLIPSSPAGSQSGSPEPTESIEPPADTVSVETIGPDGLGPAPSPPIGPAWQAGLERSLHNVLDMDAVACGDGFTLLVYGADGRYRPRALVYTSPDGIEWSRGGTLQPRGDPIAGAWAVHDLVLFRGDLWALGGEDRRLVVWRSRDCGQSWRRLPDRPAFFLGRKAIELNAVEAVATDDTLLVLGRQSGELNPRRHWAWTLDDEEGWRRIRGLGDAFDFGLTSDGQRFLASRLAEDATAGTDLVASLDGRRWHIEGHLPDRTTVIPDAARDRLLAQSELVGTGWLSPEIHTSPDAIDWSLLARAAPIPHGSSGRLYEADGSLVWLFDIWDDADTDTWSWIGVSEDGGHTWTVSAGWPGMRLGGLQSVAATDEAIVLAVTGAGFDEINAWTLPRRAVPAAPTASGPSVGIAGLWGPFKPDELTVSYTCEPPVTFMASELATAPEPDEVSPPIDIGSLVDPDDAVGLTDWRIVADDGERALAVAGRDDPAVASSIPLHYLRLARTDNGWRWEGSGDCAPQARFPETYANGGFWRLDERRPPPGPDARAIHVKVWGHREYRTSVEIRGEPVVVMTDDAALLTIPVADVSSGDMCTPGPPERITVRLPEPLGERELYDVGVLPPRRVVP